MKVVRISDPFNGQDRRAVGNLAHLGDTGADQPPIKNHTAATALAFTTPDFRTGQTELPAQDIGQALIGRGDDGFGNTIYLEGHFEHLGLL